MRITFESSIQPNPWTIFSEDQMKLRITKSSIQPYPWTVFYGNGWAMFESWRDAMDFANRYIKDKP